MLHLGTCNHIPEPWAPTSNYSPEVSAVLQHDKHPGVSDGHTP